MTVAANERFIGESIAPVKGTFDTRDMSTGGPGLPGRFTWRKKEYEVAEVHEKWIDTGPCTSGGGEKYVRKHWFRFTTTTGETMRVYCDRQARPGQRKKRWWLYAMTTADAPENET